MIKNEKARIWVNRIVSLIIAGGLMFLIMNFVVAQKIRKELDECKYEATVLLNDAKAFFENDNYNKVKETLDTLFEKHPSSNEAIEGKKLYAEIETAVQKEQELQKELDKKWEAAVGGIRGEWAKTMAAQLRVEFEKTRDQLEKDMDEVLNKEWEKMKDQIREEWEKQK
ncbi:hypothetical protein KA005_80250 [bacterium]|nr:hypothetical protein [bacterium]